MSAAPAWTVCIVSTSRADYGCLRQLIREVQGDPQLRLRLVMIGRHWSSAESATAGTASDPHTADGVPIALVVDPDLRTDEPATVGGALGAALSQLSGALAQLAPDVLVVLGDRYEIMAPVLAALVHNIPVAHLHGGELSEGAIDDSIRHAVTKLSQLHFVSTEEYAARIRQLGEAAERIFCVGAPALDGLVNHTGMSRTQLESETGLSFARPVALVTYHPVTREPGSARQQIDNLLKAVEHSGVQVIFTVANADVAGRQINTALEAFVSRDPARYKLFAHLGQERYFACLRHCAVMIGNSSSGIIEAPSFGLPVVNIGTRQDGRVRGRNVIDVGYDSEAISAGIERALDPQFRAGLEGVPNPYDPHGDRRASWRIKEILKQALAGGLRARKKFVDLAGMHHA